MVTLTYLLVGKALNVFLVCKSKFRTRLSVKIRRQTHWKFSLFGFSVVLVSVWLCNFRKP